MLCDGCHMVLVYAIVICVGLLLDTIVEMQMHSLHVHVAARQKEVGVLPSDLFCCSVLLRTIAPEDSPL